MQISDVLKSEHQLILRYIDVMERYITFGTEHEGRQLFLDKAETFIHFIQNFADGLHHAKEEEILFRHMESPDVLTHCNPLPQMLLEHDLGRSCVQGMNEALKNNDWDQLAKSAKEYAELLKSHIFKEDNILFPMAESGFGDADKQAVLAEYNKVETKLEASGLWKKYEDQLADLESSLNDAQKIERVLV